MIQLLIILTLQNVANNLLSATIARTSISDWKNQLASKLGHVTR